jgi:hypothetical protein
MDSIRDFFGYLLGVAFCMAAVALCWLAWLGLEDEFGWRWALGGVLLSVVVRINFPVVVGLYFYAYNLLHWPMTEAVGFALPGLLIIAPSVAAAVFGMIVGTAARR